MKKKLHSNIKISQYQEIDFRTIISRYKEKYFIIIKQFFKNKNSKYVFTYH